MGEEGWIIYAASGGRFRIDYHVGARAPASPPDKRFMLSSKQPHVYQSVHVGRVRVTLCSEMRMIDCWYVVISRRFPVARKKTATKRTESL